ncbi:MAG: UvrD-helicase domain-containing protein [Candidatus Moraniibacteriota bacterium]
MQNKIFANLNPPQKEAVQHLSGPALVFAGAGSGKTRVLIHRVAYLISEGIKPENILAITFTNKAAREMMDRIGKILGIRMIKKFYAPTFSRSSTPHVGTFHSIGARILREQAEKLGYTSSFAIYDTEDQRKLVKLIMREQGISEEQFPIGRIQDFISKAKGELNESQNFLENPESYFEEKAGQIYTAYQKNLKDLNAFDFDDLITVPVLLFEKDKEVKRYYQDQFRYILVDEYQDTNRAQYQFVKTLGEDHRNIFVVGDDFQSIYGWRGADLRNIWSFEEDYPEAKVILLEQNYRSTQNILDSAHEIISRNPKQKKKKMWTEKKEGEKITLYEADDQQDEAKFVISRIETIRQYNPGLPLGEIAVLYRTNAQSRVLEEEFIEAGIPYHLVGALRFYARKEIKDILAYLRLLANPKDEMSLRRIFNVPKRALGKESWKLIKQTADRENKKVGELLIDKEKFQEFLEGDSPLSPPSPRLRRAKWGKLALTLQSLRDYMEENTLSQLLTKLIEGIGYSAYLEDGDILGTDRMENVKELLTVTEKYNLEGPAKVTLNQFLEEVGLLSAEDKDRMDQRQQVHLMTMHSAKGLEFDTVFLVGMEEGLFPHSRSLIKPEEMEEERRLCYVGITRAKRKVYLIRALRRHLFGSLQANPPSRFLSEIPEELVEEYKVQSTKYDVGSRLNLEPGNSRNNGSEFNSEPTGGHNDNGIRLSVTVSNGQSGVNKSKSVDWKDGDSVFHASFGKGVIVSQDDSIITVAFAGAGVKKLDKTIAPIKRLNEKKRKRPIV